MLCSGNQCGYQDGFTSVALKSFGQGGYESLVALVFIHVVPGQDTMISLNVENWVLSEAVSCWESWPAGLGDMRNATMVVPLQKAAKIGEPGQQESTQSRARFFSFVLGREARVCLSCMPRQRALQTKARTSAHMHGTLN